MLNVLRDWPGIVASNLTLPFNSILNIAAVAVAGVAAWVILFQVSRGWSTGLMEGRSKDDNG